MTARNLIGVYDELPGWQVSGYTGFTIKIYQYLQQILGIIQPT